MTRREELEAKQIALDEEIEDLCRLVHQTTQRGRAIAKEKVQISIQLGALNDGPPITA